MRGKVFPVFYYVSICIYICLYASQYDTTLFFIYLMFTSQIVLYFFPNTPVLSVYIDVVSALSIYVFTVFSYYVYSDITRLNANKILPHFLLTPERTYYAVLKQINFYVIACPTVIQFDWMRYHCIRYCYLAKKLYSKLFGIFAINR